MHCDWWLLLVVVLALPGVFAATGMNDRSSRSHVIFSITVECSELGEDKQQHVRMGKLHLVDLAVSGLPSSLQLAWFTI